MKDSAIQSTPVSSAASRSERSLGVSALKPMVVSGTLTPLRSESLGADLDRGHRRGPGHAWSPAAARCRRQAAAGDRTSSAARISGWGSSTRLASPGSGLESSTKVWPGVSADAPVGKDADAQLWSLQIDQDADRPAFLDLDLADGRHQPAHAVRGGVAHVDAEDIGAGAEKLADHRLVGGSGAERGEDLGPPRPPHQLPVPGWPGSVS